MVALLDRRDRRWNDDSWRTRTFDSLMIEFDLTYREVADLVDRDINTVRHWRSGTRLTIPKDTLRLLVVEFLVFGLAVLDGDDGAI
jgi:hypothetical protein